MKNNKGNGGNGYYFGASGYSVRSSPKPRTAEDEMVIVRAKELAIAAGHPDPDAMVDTPARAYPVWRFYSPDAYEQLKNEGKIKGATP